MTSGPRAAETMTSERRREYGTGRVCCFFMSPPYVPVSPAQLPAWLDDPAALLLDLRPAAAYNAARLPCALSLSVPTTLLKRPLFSLNRLASMLSNPDARARFANWSSASRVLVYDADSVALSDSSVINALLRKFSVEGFTRDLAWIKGGFQAVLRDASSVIDTHSYDTHVDEDVETDSSGLPAHVLRPNRLPIAAFTLSSTTLSSYGVSPSALPSSGTCTAHPMVNRPSFSNHRHAFNPFFDVVRQNIELSHGITEQIPLCLPRHVRHRISDLPFRWLQDIARRSATQSWRVNSSVDISDSEGVDPAAVAEGAEALATQFYRIELAEQRRLMSVLEHHTKESGKDSVPSSISYPFSITAGIEKGDKNRYRHIWPFEHTRVRLHHKQDSGDDYVNASYVQPLGTRRRYIATQGPLPATFSDFWMLCWEQNVHVIVMLTREVEGSMVKCGAYWTNTAFGPLHLRLVSTSGQSSAEYANKHAGYFPPQPLASDSFEVKLPEDEDTSGRQPATIKRIFELTHAGYPRVKPRKVVHFQFLEWPDMTVPDDPRGILDLIKEVDKAVEETKGVGKMDMVVDEVGGTGSPTDDITHMELDERTGIAKHAVGRNSPVLLHCSAGVGRTGGFIAVDAILHAIRRELGATRQDQSLKLQRQGVRSKVDGKVYDVDMSENDNEMSSMSSQPLGGLSSSSAPADRCDPSSSDDSLEFEQNSQSYDKYQSPLATLSSGTSSPSIKSTTYYPTKRTDSARPASSLAPSNGISSARALLPVRNTKPSKQDIQHRQERKNKSPIRPQSMTSCSDEGEPPSRSISPSADDDSEPYPARYRTGNEDVLILESTQNSLPAPPSTFKESDFHYIDFKGPRRPHEDESPVELSSFGEPIWEVVQDMREQRMSLCQSLRQYVFVHAAIIEGALMIVDEERQRGMAEDQFLAVTSSRQPRIRCKVGLNPSPRTKRCRPIGLSSRSSGLSTAVLTGKRVASPTELPKENKRREVLLSECPSLQGAKLS
ncbi:hypothetical protein AX15_001151 [Amanita polypyramis BW_CC]|nr:hypothetical protein AX15_001151 [Amanita polypyramis BW_CC]